MTEIISIALKYSFILCVQVLKCGEYYFSTPNTMSLIVLYSLIIYIFVKLENVNGILEYGKFNELENILQQTETFFNNLKLEFKSYSSNDTTRQLIDIKVNEFVRDMIEKCKNLNEQQQIDKWNLNQENKYKQEFYSLNYFGMSKNNSNVRGTVQMNYNEKIIEWCDKIITTMPELDPKSILSKFAIKQSDKDNIDSITNLNILSKIHDDFQWRVSELKKLINTKMSIENVTLSDLKGKKIDALSHAFATSVNTQSDNEIIQNVIEYFRENRVNQSNFELRNVTITSNVNFFCPIPAVNYKIIEVKGLINGIPSFQNLMDDLLKINNNSTDNNCQIITGIHSIKSVKAIDANIPSLDVGFNVTHQNITTNYITINELEILSGGLFLPMNSPGVYEIMGTLSTSKTKIINSIEVYGHLNGTGVEHFGPIVHYQQPITLTGNSKRHMEYVEIVEWLEAKDIVGFEHKHSYNRIRSNRIPLNSFDISIHMKFQMEQINWNNVYALESSRNWLTVKNYGIFNVTGLKKIPRNVKLAPEIRDIISITKLRNSICTNVAIMQDIFTTNVTVDRVSIKNLNTDAIIGDTKIDKAIDDLIMSVLTWNKLNTQENMTSDGIEFNNLEYNLPKWIRCGVLRGPITLKKLSVSNAVETYERFIVPLPRKIRRIDARREFSVGRINGIQLDDFMKNAIRIHDEIISPINVTFTGDLEVNEIVAKKLPINFFNDNELNYNLGEKTIVGKIKTKNLDVLYLPLINNTESVVDLIINGIVTFEQEPTIQKINNWSVKHLLDNVWMKNKPAILSGKLFTFRNVIIDGGVIEVRNHLNTPRDNNGIINTWNEFQDKVLSISRAQNITQTFIFDRVHALNSIIGLSKSKLISHVSTNLYNLEHNSFQKCKKQLINFNNWQFKKIISTDFIAIKGQVNDLNLNKDIVRRDIEKNVITSTKIVDNLIADNVSNYTNFNELIRNAIMKNNTFYNNNNNNNNTKDIIITGKKIFKNVNMMNLRVQGKIAGNKIENCFRKDKKNPYFRGRKIIKGSLISRDLIIPDGNLINDINIMNLINNQLKKTSLSTQSISNPFYFQGELKIFGNATLNGRYQNIQLINSNNWNASYFFMNSEMLRRNIERLYEATETTRDIVSNRVTYWNKLEFIDDNKWEINRLSVISNTTLMETSKLIFLENLGNCHVEEMILTCNNNEITINFTQNFNISQLVKLEIVNVKGVTLFAGISSTPGGVFIFSYGPESRQFHLEIKLDLPDIAQGSLKKSRDSIWFVLDFQDRTIILRYDIWNEFQEYLIPPPPLNTHYYYNNNHQLITIFHSKFVDDNDNELLLIRNDGIWIIGGLSAPKHLIKANLNIFADVFVLNNNLYIQLIDEKNKNNNQTTYVKLRYINN